MKPITSQMVSALTVLVLITAITVDAAMVRGDASRQEATAAKLAAVVNQTQAKSSAVAKMTVQVTADAALRVAATGGPATLKEYCAGAGAAKVGEGAKVNANWRGLGTDFPGVVAEENKDGTVDVKYDDGFVEKKVDMSKVTPVETKQTADDPAHDPACDLVDFVEQVKKMVDDAYKNIAAWLANAKMKQEGRKKPTFTAPTVTAPPGAPSAAPPAGSPAATNVELELLKKQLADKDAELADLTKTMDENDKEILEEMGLSTDAKPSGMKTVDDLIAEYTAKIALRQKQIDKIKDRLTEQNEQLYAMGARTVDLSEISDQVKEISRLCDEARVKRDNLLKADKLDDELGLSLKHIFETEKKLRIKVGSLMSMDLAAKAKGSSEGDSKAADKEMVAAAMEVEKDLKGVQETTKHLNEGLHPHGEKWYRYRYEHSYVEAVLMVFISIIMFLWERGYHFLRRQVYRRSHALKHDMQTQGTMYVQWLEYCAGELMVCLLAFLTVWLLAKVHFFDYLPLLLESSDKIHLPHSGLEYRRLAIDIAVVLFMAVLFYYFLVLSVVHHTTVKLDEWALGERELGLGRTSVHRLHHASTETGLHTMEHAATGLSANSVRRSSTQIVSEYHTLKTYFGSNVVKDPELLEDIRRSSGGQEFDAQSFPFQLYLRLNVRNTVDTMFMFGWTVWILIVISFMCFCVCHRWLHMGYIRIMMSYFVLLAIAFIGMMWWVNKINQLVSMHQNDPDFNPNDHVPHFFHEFWVEGIVCHVLHYVLFFLCYGASRMICQPWMWEMHFWPVLCLTIFTAIFSIVFVCFFSPMIPLFAAAMALPPFVSSANLDVLYNVHSAEGDSADKLVHESAAPGVLAPRRGTAPR